MKPTTLGIIIAVLLIPVVALLISNRTNKPMDTTASPSASATASAPADAISAKKVILQTTKGDITINLYPGEAPRTVMNFVTLGKRGYYNGIFFHRIIKEFVIQAGDPTGTGTGGQSIYGAKFEDEINSHKIVKGTLAMANAGQNTNGSQFFIVTTTDQPNLDGGYTVFGQIDPASQPVVDAIASVAVNDPQEGKPVNPDEVKITGFVIVE